MQAVVVDSEVVGDLVDDGDRDLLHQLLAVAAHVAQGRPVDGDAVGEGTGVEVPFGQRDPLVQAEDVGLLLVAVRDQHHDVVEHRPQLVGHQVQTLPDQLLEGLLRDQLHCPAVSQGPVAGAPRP